MRYRILNKEEVWAKIHEERTVYCADMMAKRLYNTAKLTVRTINDFLLDDKAIFIEDIAPNYDNKDGE